MRNKKLFKDRKLTTELINASPVIDHFFLEQNPWIFDLWFAQPLNSQHLRLEFFLRLLRIVKPQILIETGTYLGSSTILFSRFVNIVYTIESEQKYFHLSQKRFLDLKLTNVNGIQGSSESSLDLILSKISPNSNQILVAYLDAHWNEHIPTTQELNRLMEWGGPFLALIDDFKVEDDLGYNFDKYESLTVDKSLIPKSKDLFLYYPNIPSNLESGARRGLGIVLNNKAKKMIDPDFVGICREHKFL